MHRRPGCAAATRQAASDPYRAKFPGAAPSPNSSTPARAAHLSTSAASIACQLTTGRAGAAAGSLIVARRTAGHASRAEKKCSHEDPADSEGGVPRWGAGVAGDFCSSCENAERAGVGSPRRHGRAPSVALWRGGVLPVLSAAQLSAIPAIRTHVAQLASRPRGWSSISQCLPKSPKRKKKGLRFWVRSAP